MSKPYNPLANKCVNAQCPYQCRGDCMRYVGPCDEQEIANEEDYLYESETE